MDMQGKIPVKSEKVASRIIDGEAIIVLLEKQQNIVLNQVGSRIWEIMDGKKNIDELTRTIASEFEVGYDQAIKDVSEFIEDIEKRGAVEIR